MTNGETENQEKALVGFRAMSDKLAEEIPAYASALQDEAKVEEICRAVRSKMQSAREALGVTQKALAERMDLSQSAISKLEGGTGDLGLKTLCRYAAALGMEPTIFFVPSEAAMRDRLEKPMKSLGGSFVSEVSSAALSSVRAAQVSFVEAQVKLLQESQTNFVRLISSGLAEK